MFYHNYLGIMRAHWLCRMLLIMSTSVHLSARNDGDLKDFNFNFFHFQTSFLSGDNSVSYLNPVPHGPKNFW